MLGHILARPAIVEYEAIERACAMAEITCAKLHIVHVSTGRGGEIIEQYRKTNPNISGETAPQYLFLDDEILLRENGHLFASCPQIKKKSDSLQLKKSLLNNSISFIATDHCIFSKKDKDLWDNDFTKIPYGLPGVETSLPLIYTNFVKTDIINLEKFVQITSTNPAKRFGLYPEKGTISKGSSGDILIINPEKSKVVTAETLLTKLSYSPYEGLELYGFPEYTILRGEVIYSSLKTDKKIGKFIKRKSPLNV